MTDNKRTVSAKMDYDRIMSEAYEKAKTLFPSATEMRRVGDNVVMEYRSFTKMETEVPNIYYNGYSGVEGVYTIIVPLIDYADLGQAQRHVESDKITLYYYDDVHPNVYFDAAKFLFMNGYDEVVVRLESNIDEPEYITVTGVIL